MVPSRKEGRPAGEAGVGGADCMSRSVCRGMATGILPVPGERRPGGAGLQRGTESTEWKWLQCSSVLTGARPGVHSSSVIWWLIWPHPLECWKWEGPRARSGRGGFFTGGAKAREAGAVPGTPASGGGRKKRLFPREGGQWFWTVPRRQAEPQHVSAAAGRGPQRHGARSGVKTPRSVRSVCVDGTRWRPCALAFLGQHL